MKSNTEIPEYYIECTSCRWYDYTNQIPRKCPGCGDSAEDCLVVDDGLEHLSDDDDE